MSDTNTTLLWAFCAAARHSETCSSWEAHRDLLTYESRLIDNLLAAIPNAIAVGKAVQFAAKVGQDTLMGETPRPPAESVDVKDVNLDAILVYWDTVISDEHHWYTEDPQVIRNRRNHQYYKEDARAASIEAYKPRKVKLYFNGKPDEWNEYR